MATRDSSLVISKSNFLSYCLSISLFPIDFKSSTQMFAIWRHIGNFSKNITPNSQQPYLIGIKCIKALP